MTACPRRTTAQTARLASCFAIIPNTPHAGEVFGSAWCAIRLVAFGKNFAELGLSLLRVSAVGTVAYRAVHAELPILLAVARAPLAASGEVAAAAVARVILAVLVALVVVSAADYARTNDYFRFYEINPAMVSIASGSKAVFSYLRDSAAEIDVLTGDARLLMEQEMARGELQNLDVLVLDAFNGDAIPVHLLTKEAFTVYFRHLAPSGIIAVHMSSAVQEQSLDALLRPA